MADRLIGQTAREREISTIDADGYPRVPAHLANKEIDSPWFADSLIFRLNS